MRRAPLALIVAGAAVGCSDAQPTDLAGIQAIAFIQRAAHETGNVFDYARDGSPTDQADIYVLSPPSASGQRRNLTNLPMGSDIQAMDLSFDASEIVFSARLAPDDPYHLFRINVDGTNPCEMGKTGACQITDGPQDDTYPVFLPGGRIFFTTNENVEVGVKQFRDEYERATTAQVATISLAGGDRQLGARNVSHRVFPTLLSDGRVLMTQWDHLGDKNEGNLVMMNQDLTGNREGFGKEGHGMTNAYLRAHEVVEGKLVAIGTSRDRTFQAGKILLINLGNSVRPDGTIDPKSFSEANSSAEDLTPDVPGDRTPSYDGVGRYYEAVAIGNPDDRKFLVSWSDGPVESSTLGKAGKLPSFGLYLYDAKAKTRFPIAIDPANWYSSPLPIQKRAEPPMLNSANVAQGTQSTLISAINVYDSTLFKLEPGSVKKVRLMEGFSDEEGVPGMFGLTEFDGHALLGEIDPAGDGSFKAVVPANVPIHIQLVDQFGMALASEPIWIQGRAGEARVCGGCHEDRTKTPQLAPGSSSLQALGAAALDLPRPMRESVDNYAPSAVKGVPWDKVAMGKASAGALQPIFDAHCTDCHDGTMNGANQTYTVQDLTDMATYTWTFDLTGKPSALNSAGGRMYGFTASHLSIMGPAMTFEEKQIRYVCPQDPMGTLGTCPQPKAHIEPGSAADSNVIKMLNPPQRYPSVDMNHRAFGNAPAHPAEVGVIAGHDGADPKYQLTADEYYLLILASDMGGQFYSRENAPGGSY